MQGTIELGDIAKDSITGFEGVVIAETKWLHGCRRFTLQPQKLSKDREVRSSATFDEPQLELVKKKVAATTGKTGGPRPEPDRGR